MLIPLFEAPGIGSGVPPSPFGTDPKRHFYFIRKDMKPMDHERLMEIGKVVLSMYGAKDYLRGGIIQAIRRAIEEFHEKHKQFPKSVEEAFEDATEFGLYDPLTGKWNYNPETGEVRAPSFPKM